MRNRRIFLYPAIQQILISAFITPVGDIAGLIAS